jgi:hypothetical protein
MENVMVPPDSCVCNDLNKCRCLEQVPPERAFEKLRSLLEKRKTAGVNGN